MPALAVKRSVNQLVPEDTQHIDRIVNVHAHGDLVYTIRAGRARPRLPAGARAHPARRPAHTDAHFWHAQSCALSERLTQRISRSLQPLLPRLENLGHVVHLSASTDARAGRGEGSPASARGVRPRAVYTCSMPNSSSSIW